MAKIIRSEPQPLAQRCIGGGAHSLVKFDEERMVCTACGGVLFVAEAKPEPPHFTLVPCSLPHYPCTRPHYWGQPTTWPQPSIWWGSSDTAGTQVTVNGTISTSPNES